jgi:ribonuclease H / adenosylcobalamin/alpha-ribazole phosphatase
MNLIVEADGGARGNPGPAGYGAVVRDASTGDVLAERNGALGVATNNVAEYSGLIAGLQAAAELGAREVEVRMDSKLVVEQMSGRWQIKHAGLRPLAARAAELVRGFERVTFTWVPRERNKHADALANAAMDGKSLDAGGTVPARSAPAAAVSAPVRQADASGEPVVGAGQRVVNRWEPRTETPLRLLLVRHGESELTAQRRYSGRGDVPLTTRGIAQAEAVATRIKNMGVSLAAVVTSPLTRCVRTAEALDGPQPIADPDLIECDFGAWEGLTFAEVRRRWPAEMDAWLASTDVAPPGGESMRSVSARAARAVARLRERYPAQVVAVVSHVSPIKVILRDALAATDTFLYRTYLDPAGLSIVDYWPDDGVAVRTMNDVAHLT